MINIDKYKPLLPLVYLAVIAVIAGAFHLLGVPKEMSFLVVGAGLTRVKVGGNVK